MTHTCNVHDALVEALTEILPEIEHERESDGHECKSWYTHDLEHCDCRVKRYSAALALAEGK